MLILTHHQSHIFKSGHILVSPKGPSSVSQMNRSCQNMRTIPKSTSDWLVKKYTIDNKMLLYETVTYVTALHLNRIAIHIKAFVVL
jgi:hypothetical protein